MTIHVARAGWACWTLCGLLIPEMKTGDTWMSYLDYERKCVCEDMCSVCYAVASEEERSRAARKRALRLVDGPDEPVKPIISGLTVTERSTTEQLVIVVSVPRDAVAKQTVDVLTAPGTPLEKLERLATMLKAIKG